MLLATPAKSLFRVNRTNVVLVTRHLPSYLGAEQNTEFLLSQKFVFFLTEIADRKLKVKLMDETGSVWVIMFDDSCENFFKLTAQSFREMSYDSAQNYMASYLWQRVTLTAKVNAIQIFRLDFQKHLTKSASGHDWWCKNFGNRIS
tara:strand:+ start:3032 stop:3469 length:438 start_codon:yes stop_codon:yes gene_type:complete